MRKLLLIILLLPLFAQAQQLPDFGFDKIKLRDSDQIVQTQLLQGSAASKARPDRYYYWYAANKIHATQGGFSGDLLNGDYHAYYLDKSLKEQGVFKKGLKDGTWKSWNESGSLTGIYTWKNGLRQGAFSLYDNKGKLIQSGYYKDNQLVQPDSGSFWEKLDIFKKK